MDKIKNWKKKINETEEATKALSLVGRKRQMFSAFTFPDGSEAVSRAFSTRLRSSLFWVNILIILKMKPFEISVFLFFTLYSSFTFAPEKWPFPLTSSLKFFLTCQPWASVSYGLFAKTTLYSYSTRSDCKQAETTDRSSVALFRHVSHKNLWTLRSRSRSRNTLSPFCPRDCPASPTLLAILILDPENQTKHYFNLIQEFQPNSLFSDKKKTSQYFKDQFLI